MRGNRLIFVDCGKRPHFFNFANFLRFFLKKKKRCVMQRDVFH